MVSPALRKLCSIAASGVSQTVSGSGIAARSAAVSGSPSSSVKAKRPPGGSDPATARTSASLSSIASIASSSSTTSNEPAGSGGTRVIAKRRSGARSRAIATALSLKSTPR